MNKKPNSMRAKSKEAPIDFIHYTRLLIEKKYWILLITVAISLLWYLILPTILAKKQNYTYQAVIRFEDPRIRARVGNIDERLTMVETESRTKVIKTTKFLSQVIDSLKLNVLSSTPGLNRDDIFSQIELERDLRYGRYSLRKEKFALELYYTNKKEGIKDKLLQAVRFGKDSIYSFDVNGLNINVYQSAFKDRDKVTFECIPSPYLIQILREKLNLRLNRQQTLLEITFEYNDPVLGAQIVNTIANLFLEQSLESKRFRTRQLLASLENQLRSSKAELEKSENTLRTFRERNPHIYLTEDLAAFNQRLITNELSRDEVQSTLERIKRLDREKIRASNSRERELIYQEMLSFLQAKNVSGINALVQQYQDAINEKQALLDQQYSQSHPRLVEINQILKNLQSKIDERVSEYIKEQNNRLLQVENNIAVSEKRLRQSPRKELQLAKLQRDRNAKSEIYSNLLMRYNEVKVAHVSITPDAELLQQAEVPVVISDLKEKLKKLFLYLLGPLLGLSLGFGLFIMVDLISHKARSASDIENLLDIPVIATIPLIGTDKNIPDEFDTLKRMDPKLITIDFTPTPASEAFRTIRTQLVLNKGDEENQSFLLSSQSPSEGKSLVAANLAITFSQLKKPTILIDADLRRGVLHSSFLIRKRPGLSDILSSRSPIDMENVYSIIQKTTIPNLHIIPKGKEVPNPSEVLIGNRLEELFSQIQKYFQYIIIDTAPIGLIADALVINKLVDYMILVTRYGETDIKKLKKTISDYEGQENNIKGIILNGVDEKRLTKYSSYSYYKY